MISLFEREVIILTDVGLSECINEAGLKKIIDLMKVPLKRHEVRRAMEIALDELIVVIKPLPTGKINDNELSDRIIEEKGL